MSIQLRKVRYTYPKTKQGEVINIDSWSVAAGQSVFLRGPSGCGKSTLLNLISGVLKPRHGEIEVLGQRVDQMLARTRDEFRANNIGYVFQQFNLIPYMSAMENIQLANYFSQNRKAEAREFGEHLLETLNVRREQWRKPAGSLSVGQQQRIAIARALINKPKLLIADEPTSSLDHDNRDSFITLLMQLCAEQSITLLFVSHDGSLSHHFERTDDIQQINQVEVVQ